MLIYNILYLQRFLGKINATFEASETWAPQEGFRHSVLQKSKVGYDDNGSMVAARPRLAWPVIFVHEIVKTNWKYDCTKKKETDWKQYSNFVIN